MLNKFLVLIAVAAAMVLAVLVVVIYRPGSGSKNTIPLEQITGVEKIEPSETLIEYIDPAGFKFSYSDNISVSKKEVEDPSVYSSLQLYANGINGSINIEVTDSKFKTIDEWVDLNKAAASEPPKETKLGELKAFEVGLKDRLLLGALDQGVLFTIEMPRIEEEFWSKVYQVIIKEFTFVAPEQATTTSSEEIQFEGEEVVE